MKRIIGAGGLMVLLLTSGCATQEFVKSQTDPLAERLGKLEQKVNDLEGKAGLSDADKAAIKAADDKAQQALDAANKLSVDTQKAEAAAQRAEAAADRAEAAAQQAQHEEKKSEKLFKLEQKK
ncbi:hypothetical protein GURASL_00660 [Geotalea uraniireducens]|uniref:Lipoprotein n=1 Tax=Geotalea uraniireducens TaxID=351604 RepID=A0ABN6VMA6_9BACT|nr:hypothetical protein [Geotalea uraniireducens]BDV41143.1 hypothetical protein GURASL_00660 [Geotalea uraniireducens]